MITKFDIIEKETNILGFILILFILLFANMSFFIGTVAFLGDPKWYNYIGGLYHPLLHRGFDGSTMTLMENTRDPIFIFSLKENIFSIILAVITIIALRLKKYRIACIWFFLLSLGGLNLFYLIFQDNRIWYFGINFLSEKILLLVASCISLIIGIRILRINMSRLFNQEATGNPASPDTRA